jgi:hypothetical protein
MKNGFIDLIVIFALIIPFPLFSANIGSAKIKISDARAPLPSETTDFFNPNTTFPRYPPPVLDNSEVIGDTFLCGTTWCDAQHNATCGRNIQIDNDSWTHIVWMNGMNSVALDRHIWYQSLNPNGVLSYTTPTLGIQIDQEYRGGYPVIELDSGINPIVAAHLRESVVYDNKTNICWWDRLFQPNWVELPEVLDPFSQIPLELIWPKMSIDRNTNFHILSQLNPWDFWQTSWIYYCRADLDTIENVLNFETPEQIFISDSEVLSVNTASSQVSDRTAIVWHQPWATVPDTNIHDNDLILCISDDGINWDFTDTINITNWIPPDWNLLPDTTLARRILSDALMILT